MDEKLMKVDGNFLHTRIATEKWMTVRIVDSVAVNHLACEVGLNRMSCRRSRYDVEVTSLASAVLRLMAIMRDYVLPEMVYYERKRYLSRPRHQTGSAGADRVDEKQALPPLLRLPLQQCRYDDFGDESVLCGE